MITIRPRIAPPIVDSQRLSVNAERTSTMVSQRYPVEPQRGDSLSIPVGMLLNGRFVRIGSFSVPKDKNAQRLLAEALRPSDAVHEYSVDDSTKNGYHYFVQVPHEATDNAQAGRLEVHVQVDNEGNLKSLQASHLDDSSRNNAQGYCLDHRFEQISPTRLSNLPNEILLNITSHLNDRTLLKMRKVSTQMQGVSTLSSSEATRFILVNGQALSDSDYRGHDMRVLAGRSKTQQGFVLAQGQALRQLGFQGSNINDLAQRPDAEGQYILAHGPMLRGLGLDAWDMQKLAGSVPQQQFVELYGAALKELGFDGLNIRYLAERNQETKDFALTFGPVLKAMGVSGSDLGYLTNFGKTAKQQIAQQLSSELHKNGVSGKGIGYLLSRAPIEELNFILQNLKHAEILDNAGLINIRLHYLLKLDDGGRNFVLRYTSAWPQTELSPDYLIRLAGESSQVRSNVVSRLGLLGLNS